MQLASQNGKECKKGKTNSNTGQKQTLGNTRYDGVIFK